MKNILLILILFFVSCEKQEVEKSNDDLKYDHTQDHFWPGNNLRLIAGEGITIVDSGEYLIIYVGSSTSPGILPEGMINKDGTINFSVGATINTPTSCFMIGCKEHDPKPAGWEDPFKIIPNGSMK